MLYYLPLSLFSSPQETAIYCPSQVAQFFVRKESNDTGETVLLCDQARNELFRLRRRAHAYLPNYVLYRGSEICARISRSAALSQMRVRVSGHFGTFTVAGDAGAMAFRILRNTCEVASVQHVQTQWGEAFLLETEREAPAAFFCALVIAAGYCIQQEEAVFSGA